MSKICNECGQKIINNLARHRKSTGKTLEQIAVSVGVTRQAVSSWEINSSIPKKSQIENVANAYCLSVGNLVEVILGISDPQVITPKEQ